jgi:hypothetical protein
MENVESMAIASVNGFTTVQNVNSKSIQLKEWSFNPKELAIAVYSSYA